MKVWSQGVGPSPDLFWGHLLTASWINGLHTASLLLYQRGCPLFQSPKGRQGKIHSSLGSKYLGQTSFNNFIRLDSMLLFLSTILEGLLYVLQGKEWRQREMKQFAQCHMPSEGQRWVPHTGGGPESSLTCEQETDLGQTQSLPP